MFIYLFNHANAKTMIMKIKEMYFPPVPYIIKIKHQEGDPFITTTHNIKFLSEKLQELTKKRLYYPFATAIDDEYNASTTIRITYNVTRSTLYYGV